MNAREKQNELVFELRRVLLDCLEQMLEDFNFIQNIKSSRIRPYLERIFCLFMKKLQQ